MCGTIKTAHAYALHLSAEPYSNTSGSTLADKTYSCLQTDGMEAKMALGYELLGLGQRELMWGTLKTGHATNALPVFAGPHSSTLGPTIAYGMC